jgi:hypothetical protein
VLVIDVLARVGCETPLSPKLIVLFQLCKHPSACYVKGRLQPTRAFGDFHLKSGKEWRGDEWVPTRVRPGPFTPPYVTDDSVKIRVL